MQNTLREKLKEVKYFLLDMDGTLYIEDEVIGDMPATLKAIRAAGKRVVYLTNNSSKSVSVYEEKLKKLGLWADGDLVYTSGMSAIGYLKNNHAGKKVYLVGTNALKAEFLSSGIELTEDFSDVALLSYDTELTYEKLCKFTNYITKGALYVATHPDINCPAKDVYLPDIGSFIALIEKSTGKLPSVNCGKPFKIMGDSIKSFLNATDSEIIMVGDRLSTDIKFGGVNGFSTILVYSGETDEAAYKAQDIRAGYELPSLNEIVKHL